MSESYRELFNGVDTFVTLSNGQEVIPINFDNAATTPPLKKVDEFIYENILMYGSVGRGGHKSSYCTNAYEISRQEVLNFFNLSSEEGYEVIYVKNTTEGMNVLANMLCDRNSQKVLTTRMEHHANDLPWRELSKTYYCEVDHEGKMNLCELEEKLRRAQGTIQYVTMTGASNVTGYINPIHKAARLAHKYGAKIIIDAAQLIAHRAIDMKGGCPEEAIDALVFSGHKMYAPFGSGIIIVRREMIANKKPFLLGGGIVSAVFDDDVYYKPSPYKEEAGSPNFLGAMAIVAAMAVFKNIGYKQIIEHEERLKKRLISGLQCISDIILYGDNDEKERVGVIPFNFKNIHHSEAGELFQEIRGIAVRTGCFCAHPYVMRLLDISNEARYKYIEDSSLKSPGMIRASFGLYNTEEEVDEFLNYIEDIIKLRR